MDLYYVDGFAFSSREEYSAAVKEYKSCAAIRARMDLDKPESVYHIYSRLVGKKLLTTPVGISFLTELRYKLIHEFHYSEKDLPPISITSVSDRETRGSQKLKQALASEEKTKRHMLYLRIVCVGLAAVIIGMFAITVRNGSSGALGTENRILDKYSSWEEELEKREKAVSEKEAELGITPGDSTETTEDTEQ